MKIMHGIPVNKEDVLKSDFVMKITYITFYEITYKFHRYLPIRRGLLGNPSLSLHPDHL